MPQNIILNSLKESFLVIWKKKLLFILVLFTQILFFSGLFYISLTYQTRIYESVRGISDYIQEQQLDDVAVAQNIIHQRNILGDDPLSISRNFNDVVHNFRLYLIYTFIALIIFLPLLWSLSERFHGNISLRHLFRNFIIASSYLILIFVFFYSMTSISFSSAASGLLLKYSIFFIFSVVLLYFMYISLSLAKSTELKDIIPKTLKIGVRKIHYVVSVYLINSMLLILPIFLMAYFIDSYFAISIVGILFLMFSTIFGRIFMISVVKKLENS